MTWPQWTSMLTPWQWGLLAAVPPAIVALYFLKLKRTPLEVPSTYLWRKSIEDMHVNSLWQRLRRSLLLLLQLLLILLLAVALLRPTWQGSILKRDRLIFLIDNSASMSATDVRPTRLDEAKRRVQALVDEMRSGDVAMIVSFADNARVEQMFTDNRGELRRRVDAIQPTDKTTTISEALRVASVLANPGRSATDVRDTQVAEALPAQLFFFSDGNFADDPDFSLGNLEPEPPVWIGRADAANVAIVAFSTAASENDPEKIQAFGRLENSGPADAALDVELLLDGELIDAQQVTIPAGKSRGVAFDLERVASGVLELRLPEDDLAVDNRAWAVMEKPRRTRLLLVTDGDEALQVALSTDRTVEMAEVTTRPPPFLATPEYEQGAAAGHWDLIIFDRCQPTTMPQANTLFIAALPPGDAWRQDEPVPGPQIIDTNRAHPLMQWLDLSDVLVAEARPVRPPAGGTMLIESNRGLLLAMAPREGFEDVVMGFELAGGQRVGTNWPLRPSFPVFVLNALQYLGVGRSETSAGSVQPGRPVTLRLDTPRREITVLPPGRAAAAVSVARGKQNAFHFTGTSSVGLYDVRDGGQTVQRFAVNLFEPAESNIAVRPDKALRIGHVDVGHGGNWEVARRDGWKFALLGALAVLLVEWYIYNRRAYL